MRQLSSRSLDLWVVCPCRVASHASCSPEVDGSTPASPHPSADKNAAAFHDVTHGINDANDYSDWWGGFRAIPGWDPATGVGTPNFAALAELRHVDMSNCNLSAGLPASIGLCASLQRLSLRDCAIHHLTDEIGSLSR